MSQSQSSSTASTAAEVVLPTTASGAVAAADGVADPAQEVTNAGMERGDAATPSKKGSRSVPSTVSSSAKKQKSAKNDATMVSTTGGSARRPHKKLPFTTSRPRRRKRTAAVLDNEDGVVVATTKEESQRQGELEGESVIEEKVDRPPLPNCRECKTNEAEYCCVECTSNLCTKCSITIHSFNTLKHHNIYPQFELLKSQVQLQLKKAKAILHQVDEVHILNESGGDKIKRMFEEDQASISTKFAAVHAALSAREQQLLVLLNTEKEQRLEQFSQIRTNQREVVTETAAWFNKYETTFPEIKELPALHIQSKEADSKLSRVMEYRKSLSTEEKILHRILDTPLLNLSDCDVIINKIASLGKVGNAQMDAVPEVANSAELFGDEDIPIVTRNSGNELQASPNGDAVSKVVGGISHNTFKISNSFGVGTLTDPCGVLLDALNNVSFIAEYGNHRIQKLNANGEFEVIRPRDNERRTVVKLNYPAGICRWPSSGHLIVADSGNNIVRVFNESWLQVGHVPLLNEPFAVTCASQDKMLIAEAACNKISVYDVNKLKFIQSITGQGRAELGFPNAVAVDQKGEIVVSDKQHQRVSFFSMDGDFLRSIKLRRFPHSLIVQENGYLLVGRAPANSDEHALLQYDVRNVSAPILSFCSASDIINGCPPVITGLDCGPNSTLVASDATNSCVHIFERLTIE